MNGIHLEHARFETVLVLLLLGLGAAAASIPTPPDAEPSPDAASTDVVRAGNDCLEPLWHFSSFCLRNPITE